MSCLPKSGGCERPQTDAFIRIRNSMFGSHFEHRACLDRSDSSRPQPEALYEDPQTGESLVVERKTFAWPLNYVQLHQNDHFLAETITGALADIEFDDLYEVQLPMLRGGTRLELRPLALDIAARIRARWKELPKDKVFVSAKGAALPWRFLRVSEVDREDLPSGTRGLRFDFVGTFEVFGFGLEHPPELVEQLERLYASCQKKFLEYGTSTRVLLLEPQGDITHNGDAWWKTLFELSPPPECINEIWEENFDYVDDKTREWIFEQVFRRNQVTPVNR